MKWKDRRLPLNARWPRYEDGVKKDCSPSTCYFEMVMLKVVFLVADVVGEGKQSKSMHAVVMF